MNLKTPNPISTITNITALIWAFIILAVNPDPLASVVAFLLVALAWTSGGFHFMENNDTFTKDQQRFWQKADVISIYALLCCTIVYLLGNPLLLPVFALAAGLLASLHKKFDSFLIIGVLFVFILTILAMNNLLITGIVFILFATAFALRQFGETTTKHDLFHGAWHLLSHSAIGLIAILPGGFN